MRRLALVILLGALAGCATTSTDTDNTKAIGDSSATIRVGKIVTTTETAPDGTVTVTETCEDCRERTSVGGKGSADFYEKFAMPAIQAIIGVGAIVLQALR